MVQVPGLLVEGQQDVQPVAQRWHRPHADAELEHHRPALDLGRVGAKGVDVVAAAGHGEGQHVAGRDGVVDARFAAQAEQQCVNDHVPP